jgi:hypothetical protein
MHFETGCNNNASSNFNHFHPLEKVQGVRGLGVLFRHLVIALWFLVQSCQGMLSRCVTTEPWRGVPSAQVCEHTRDEGMAE